MAIKLNRKGYNHAKALIEQGKVDRESSWSFSAEDGNKILGDPPDWEEFGKWHLGVREGTDPETKEHWAFPFGKNGKVYRRGVIAAKQRAAQQGYTEIENAADRLLKLIDKDEEKAADDIETRDAPPTGTLIRRTFPCEVRGILDEENRIVELSFSSEAPVERWFGPEILLHTKKAANFKPLKEVGSVLVNHDPDQRVAKPLRVWLDEDSRKSRAIIQFGSTQRAQEAFQEVKEGLLRGVSFGYRVYEWVRIREKETWEGFKGPAWIATRWEALEISLTPVPADSTVGVGRSVIENKDKEDVDMPKDIQETKETMERQETKAPEVTAEELKRAREEAMKRERERVREIREMCRALEMTELEDELIDQGVSIEEARKIVIEKLAERRGPVGPIPNVEVTVDERDKVRAAMRDGVLARAGVTVQEPAEGYGDFAGMRLEDLARECLRRAGIPIPAGRMAMLERAFTHTSSDFPIVLKDVVNKSLLDAYREIPTTFNKWTRRTSASDFKKMYKVRLGSFPDLPVVREGAEYSHVTLSEEGESYAIGTYGALFSITRQTIINDDLDAFNRIPRKLGQAAKRTIEKTVYAILNSNPTMSDGNALFSSAHANLGTAGAIDETTLNEARKLFMEQKDVDGNPISVKPRFLLVPPAIATTADKWMNSTYTPGGTNEETNVFKGFATVIETAYLAAIMGGSDTAWYLAADPNVIDTIEVAYLDGRDTPSIESQQGFEIDGMIFKVRIDFGAAAIDWRGLFKNAGA